MDDVVVRVGSSFKAKNGKLDTVSKFNQGSQFILHLSYC